MKINRISIKWKIFFYLLFWACVLLVVLWFFQVVYYPRFYKQTRVSELSEAENDVLKVIGKDNLRNELESIAKKYNLCIIVTDEKMNSLCSVEMFLGCNIHKMSNTELEKCYKEAQNNNGELNIRDISKYRKDENRHTGADNDEKIESIVKVKIITDKNDNKYVVFLDSVVSPVEATVHTLKIQHIYISVVMLVISLLIAILISRWVSYPIIKINEASKAISKGNFKVKFVNEKYYKEVMELADTLNQTAKELVKTDILQKELIANVSHDLRTPLTMINAYAEVMRDIPGENTPENVQVIIDETKHLTLLVNDLLDMSKIQAGVAKLETKEFNLTESIKSTIQRHAKFLEPYGYSVTFKYDRNAYVEADEFKIYQVMYNLMGNAVNYCGVEKKVDIFQIIDNDIVRIEVRDDGEGIEEDKMDNVWERYYKVNKSHKRYIIGTGLGLSIVKNILELHNARYGVESKMGEGCCFWFELPLIRGDIGEVEQNGEL